MPSTLLACCNTPEAGATNISPLGEEFDIEFQPGLDYNKYKRVRICVAEAACVFSFPNIKASMGNNTLYYGTSSSTQYTIVLPDGLYSIDALNTALSYALQINGHDQNLFQFAGDESTGFVWLNKAASTTAFHFSFGVNSPKTTLGFVAGNYPATATTAASSIRSTSTAQLNTLQNIMIHCSLASGASFVGNKPGACLASFTPGDAQPWQTITYRPYFQQYVDVHLGLVSRITFWLTDQTGKRGTIDTMGENWSVSLLIEAE